MKKNKKKLLSLLGIILLGSLKSIAQVNDVSVIVSPTIEYQWWNKNLTIDNMPLYGGKIGFGFGALFEIRAFYLHGDNADATARPLGWNAMKDWTKNTKATQVDLKKYGGELKLNLWRGTFFAPYLTVGAGVQQMMYNTAQANAATANVDLKDEQLFAALGLGAKFNLTNRAVLSFEAKNTMFNASDGNYLLRPEYSKDNGGNHLYNWTAAATLDLYLGGTAYNSKDAISREYHKMFSSGFKGIKFVAEPSLVYLNFDKDFLLTDTYLLGGSAGFDLSSLVGIRGFYYQATKEANKPSLSFNNNLALYGGNIITRLNMPRGITPYLQLGGGYMKVGNEYVAKNGKNTIESSAFAMGGAGIEIPLSKNIALYGTANAIFMPKKDIEKENVQNTNHIKTSMMYTTGIRFNIGESANGTKAYHKYLLSKVAEEREASNKRINDLRAEYNEQINSYNDKLSAYDEKMALYSDRVNALKAQYEKRIAKLDNDLTAALQNKDTLKVTEIIRIKDKNQRELENIENEEMKVKRNLVNGLAQDNNNEVKLTRKQLNELVDRIIDEARMETRNKAYYYDMQPTGNQPMGEVQPRNNAETEQLKRELKMVNEKLNKVIGQKTNGVVYQENSIPAAPLTPAFTHNNENLKNTNIFRLNRIALFTGIGFGDLTAYNVGVRGYMQVASTNLDFVPELYAGMGKSTGFGLSGNVVYNIHANMFRKFTPYVGFGLGIFHGDKTHVGSNIILGVSTHFLGDKAFVDYSARSLTKQNQLVVGYSFIF